MRRFGLFIRAVSWLGFVYACLWDMLVVVGHLRCALSVQISYLESLSLPLSFIEAKRLV